MSRLTGNEVQDLMEAYNTVYAPQELTEEQIWEEVENWVNSLLEEGYDLSEYTWEEMYESYLSEMGQRMTTGQMTAPKAAPTPTPTSRPQVAGGGMGGRRGGGSSPGGIKPSFQSTGGFGRYAPPSQQVRTPAPARPAQSAPARPAAPAPARPSGGTPTSSSSTPGGPKITPTSAPSKPTATTTPTPAPSVPRQKDTSITDMIGRSQVRQGAPINTGSTSSDARAMAARSSVGATPKPAAAPARPMGGARARMLGASFDLFDVIKGHLIDEGYAETPEAAEVIMVNMSEEWRESIVEEVLDERNRGEQGMSDREVTRRRNLGGSVRSRVSASSLGDHGPQSAIQKFHKGKAKQRREIHKSGRGTRGDTGESGGQSRYQANKDHSDGYPSITKRGDGPY